MAYMILKKRNKFGVAENHDYKETDSENSVQSSLKCHPFVGIPVHHNTHTYIAALYYIYMRRELTTIQVGAVSAEKILNRFIDMR